MKAMIHYLVNRGLVVNLVSVFLMALGGYAVFDINREAFPNVNIDKIQVDVHYPGASPAEVEQLLITPIEQELRALNGIDSMISMSFPGSGRIVMDVDPAAHNRIRLPSEISLAVDRADLPNDLPDEPFVTEIEGSVFPVIRMAVSAPMDEVALKRLGDDIKDDLLQIKGIAKAVISGARKSEIRVVVDPAKMARQRISVEEIANTLARWNLNTPGGDLDTPEGQKAVRIVGEFENEQDAANLVLRANASGNVLKLSDVADVHEALALPQVLHEVAGKPALSLLILKKSNADIIETVDAIREYAKEIPKRYGKNLSVQLFQDFSRFARLRLGVLSSNGKVGLILVFVSLLLFLRRSVAMTTTWGLPIIFMSGLFVLFSFGVTLNLISMMAFIMVLGMLVDDAIIIGENITYHMENGMQPNDAAVKGSVELIGPVTTTILTTVAAFLPMFFVSGIIGKFIVAIPMVVITLLVLSWLESFLMLPSHVAHFTNPNKHPPERAWIVALEKAYGWVLSKAVRHYWVTVLVSTAILLGSLVLAKSMLFQLFPPVGVDEFVVRVSAPPGTNLIAMRDNLRAIDKEMRKHIKPEYLEATLQKSGDVSVDEGDPLTQRGSRYGQIRSIYVPAVTRPEHNAVADMRKLEGILTEKFPELKISLTEIRPGPPVGRALEADIISYDDRASEKAARQLMDYLQTIKGVTTIDSGLKKGDDELRVRLDRELATYAGVNLATASRQIRAASGGLVVSSIRRGKEEIDVTIRFPEKGAGELAQLKKLLIPNNRDGLVPLEKIAKFETKRGLTTIRHKEGVRIVNVVADIDSAVLSSSELNRLVRANEKQWQGELLSKVSVQYGGEEEKNQESFQDMIFAFGFALIAIFFILAIQFNNLSYPFMVMLAIPFGAIGIILSFYLHGIFWKPMPLSFFSTLGMVALTGVVVNSSLILLVFIQRAHEEGMDMFDAIILAGHRRLRAVLLTATTTVVGLLPTAYGWGGLDPFVSPMALALSSGLAFATVVTLITIPAVLYAGHKLSIRVKSVVHRLRKGLPN